MRRRVRGAMTGVSIVQDRPTVRDILLALLHPAAATDVVKAENLKIRALPFGDYLVASDRHSFFHVSLCMLAGRTPVPKPALSVALRKKSERTIQTRAHRIRLYSLTADALAEVAEEYRAARSCRCRTELSGRLVSKRHQR